MIVRSLRIKEFGPIKDKSYLFHPETNIFYGLNGSGKTHLLYLLGGLLGGDDTSWMVKNRPVGEVELEAEHDGSMFRFHAEGIIHGAEVLKFKKSLPSRINFPLTDRREGFVTECDSEATDRDSIRDFFTAVWHEDVRENVHFDSTSGLVELRFGDGFRRAMCMKSFDSPDGAPLLIEHPERHLHISAQYRIIKALSRAERQLFVTTHSPEITQWVEGNPLRGSYFDMGEEAGVDL